MGVFLYVMGAFASLSHQGFDETVSSAPIIAMPLLIMEAHVGYIYRGRRFSAVGLQN